MSNWDILDFIPDGWGIDKTAGSPLPMTVFITNGKSVISGEQKRALLRIKKEVVVSKMEIPTQTPIVSKMEIVEPTQINQFPAKTVNELARKKFLEKLLMEIKFDLMVCEIENWDKLEYIKEIKKLINSLNTNVKNSLSMDQLELFGELK